MITEELTSHWTNPMGNKRAREFRWYSPYKLACWSADYHDEEQRLDLEGQMDDNHYDSFLFSLDTAILNLVTVHDSLFLPNNIRMVTRCKIIIYHQIMYVTISFVSHVAFLFLFLKIILYCSTDFILELLYFKLLTIVRNITYSYFNVWF